MARSSIRIVAIVKTGPAGSYLATTRARAGILTCESTTKRCSLGLLSSVCQHSLGDKDPSRLQIH